LNSTILSFELKGSQMNVALFFESMCPFWWEIMENFSKKFRLCLQFKLPNFGLSITNKMAAC
jgi:hypothetical protein